MRHAGVDFANLRGMKKLIVVVALAGCQNVPPNESSRPIINGTVESGDPAVGFTSYAFGYFTCTATLIGRRTALTAAHCSGGEGAIRTFCTAPCADLNQCPSSCVTGIAHVYPGYGGTGDFDHDIAVIN